MSLSHQHSFIGVGHTKGVPSQATRRTWEVCLICAQWSYRFLQTMMDGRLELQTFGKQSKFSYLGRVFIHEKNSMHYLKIKFHDVIKMQENNFLLKQRFLGGKKHRRIHLLPKRGPLAPHHLKTQMPSRHHQAKSTSYAKCGARALARLIEILSNIP